MPAAAVAPASPPDRRAATATPTAPFAASSSATATPAAAPDARRTLAAPRFPLPIDRRSTAPHRDHRYANGIEPSRYATASASVISSQPSVFSAHEISTRQRRI